MFPNLRSFFNKEQQNFLKFYFDPKSLLPPNPGSYPWTTPYVTKIFLKVLFFIFRPENFWLDLSNFCVEVFQLLKLRHPSCINFEIAKSQINTFYSYWISREYSHNPKLNDSNKMLNLSQIKNLTTLLHTHKIHWLIYWSLKCKNAHQVNFQLR